MKSRPLLRLALASCLAALSLCATLVIRIPLPNGGYLNVGDAAVIITGCLLAPKFAFLSAAIGSGLADLIAGYTVYIPVTFIIKGVMALLVALAIERYAKTGKEKKLPLLTFLIAEVIMVLGYYLFEGFLYGFVASLSGVLFNTAQGLVGAIIATLIMSMILRRTKK